MDFPNHRSEKVTFMMRLCSLFYGLALVTSNTLVTESAKGAPPTVPDGVKTKYIVQEGTKNWKLTCAAEGERPLLITWTKDGESITSAWPRFKQSNEAKNLQIRNVALEDSGTYKCRASNGFGSVEIEYTVFVVGKDGLPPSTMDEYSDEDFSPPQLDGAGKAPFWVDASQTLNSASLNLVRPAGGSVRLQCHAAGLPKPDIIWLKDGKEMDDTGMPWSRGKWALQLKDLQPMDTGNYTCRIFNIWGSLNATFMVKVQNNDPTLTQFEQLYPVNTTVNEGESATLQCRVCSPDKPVLQWIKVIDDPSHLEFNQSVEVHGLHIAVLDKKYSSDTVDFRNTTYSKLLYIPQVSSADVGWYVCVVTSQKGHLSHKFAFLNVISASDEGSVSSGDQTLPLHIVVGIPVAFVLLVLVGYAIYFLQKHQQKPSRLRTVAQPSSSSSATSSSRGHRPPPPPSYPPPSLPPSSQTAPNAVSVQSLSHNGATGSSADSSSQQHHQSHIHLQQHQPLLYTSENGYVQSAAPPAAVYKPDYKAYHRLDPQSTVALNCESGAPAGESMGNGDVTQVISTPQPYELRYDDSDFSDSCCDVKGSGRIQHYPSLYSCR